MKKVIDVREFNPPPGKEYDTTQYPGPGLFRTPAGWMMVYPTSPATQCVINVGCGFYPPIPMEDYVEPKVEQGASSITAADLIKAVAVSQNPSLAKELLK